MNRIVGLGMDLADLDRVRQACLLYTSDAADEL